MFDLGSILVRRRLVASKRSSLDATCVRLTYFFVHLTLPRTQTSLSLSRWKWKAQRKAGRRQPCGSSSVTRFALASTMRKTKRLRWRLSLTYFTTFASRHVLLLISIRVFCRYIRGSLQNIGKKVHSLNSAQFTGLDTAYGKVPWTLDFWDWASSTSDSLPRVGDVNISFPGVGVNIRFPRVGDVNISPGWVSSTSDQSQEWS